MSGRYLLDLAAAALLAALLAAVLPTPFRRPAATNHRGVVLPYVLGPAVWLSITLVLAVDLAAAARGEAALRSRVALLVALGLVYAAGRLDDRQPERVRGLRAHAGALRHGRITSGAVKVVAIVGA